MACIKAVIGAMPLLGSVLAGEVGLLLVPPVTRRRDEWLEDLARRVRDLEKRGTGFRFEDLVNDEQFISARVQATQAAVKRGGL